jgi:hypothetical protein
MQSWKEPVYPSGRLELHIIGDWFAAIGSVIKVLSRFPLFAALLIGMSALDASPFTIPFIGLGEELVILYMCYAVIKMTWARINHLDVQDVFSEFKGAERRVWGLTVNYSLNCFFLGLLFIIPGVRWGIQNSIALAVTCLEQLPVAESFTRSQELLKGHMWIACKYMFLMPFLILAIILGTAIGSGALIEAVKSQPSPIDLNLVTAAVAFLDSLAASIFQLCVASIMVRMYAYAKGRQEMGTATYVPNLTPTWDKD